MCVSPEGNQDHRSAGDFLRTPEWALTDDGLLARGVKALRALTPSELGGLCFRAVAALILEALASFPFYFSPGWRNFSWPAGLTIYRVWLMWLTLTLFVMIMTFGVAAGSLVSLLCCVVPIGRRHAGILLGTWMIVWAIFSAVTCVRLFQEIYASTLEMWPNGYPG